MSADRTGDWSWSPIDLAGITTEASAAGTVAALRDLADHIEQNPATVLIGLWSTGFAEAGQFHFQVITEEPR